MQVSVRWCREVWRSGRLAGVNYGSPASASLISPINASFDRFNLSFTLPENSITAPYGRLPQLSMTFSASLFPLIVIASSFVFVQGKGYPDATIDEILAN